MEWKSKTHSWDFTEIEQEAIPNYTGAINGSSSINCRRKTGDFMVDLKLGQMGSACEEPPDKWKELGGAKTVPSPPTPMKKARATNGGTLSVSCLVDGCDADLSNCREYHRRHKVCERHSKTPEVTIGGQKKRFCQQCSRFHSLEEFDEVKRSCRKRLDGHNRRRRKPQPDPALHSGNMMSRYRGMELSPFSSPSIFPTSAMLSSSWPGLAGTKAETKFHDQQQLQLLEKQNPFIGSSSNSFGVGAQHSFLQCHNSFPGTQASYSHGGPGSRTHLKTASPSGDICSHKFLCDGLLDQVSGAHRAPSLLSMTQTQETSGISLSSMQPQSAPLEHTSFPSLQFNNVELMDSVNVPHANGAGSLHCEGIIHVESDESTGNKGPTTIPFYWE